MIQIGAEAIWRAADRKGFWTCLADRMVVALREQAAAQAASSPRQIIRTNTGNGLGLMAAVAEKPGKLIMGVKIVSLTKRVSQGSPSHPGVVVLIDPVSGDPKVSLDADSVTAIRTAATTCAVTRHVRPEAVYFTIIGTGIEARSHPLALSSVYPKARFTVWGRRFKLASNLASRYACQHISVSAEPDLMKAIKGAHVITSVTAARSPFLDINHVDDAAHVNAIGASIPGLSEWIPESFRNVDVIICDTVEECRRQSIEIPDDLLDAAHNVSAVLDEPCWKIANLNGRRSVYKSVGSAVLDVAAGAFLVDYLQS